MSYMYINVVEIKSVVQQILDQIDIKVEEAGMDGDIGLSHSFEQDIPHFKEFKEVLDMCRNIDIPMVRFDEVVLEVYPKFDRGLFIFYRDMLISKHQRTIDEAQAKIDNLQKFSWSEENPK